MEFCVSAIFRMKSNVCSSFIFDRNEKPDKVKVFSGRILAIGMIFHPGRTNTVREKRAKSGRIKI